MPRQDTKLPSSKAASSSSNGRSPTVGRLPLIAIAGSAGKTSTGWMLVQILERAGREVGAWLSNGVYVDRTLRHDELHAWELATFAARAKEIDVLVQEIPSVLASGLPENSVGVGVFTSICGSDGQCQRGPAARREQKAIETLAGAIGDGRLVANADDLMIVDAVAQEDRSITYYALNGGNPILREHVRAGGDACWIHNGWVKVQLDGAKRRIIRADEIPDTLGGHLLFQVQNALAAIAAALPILGPDFDFGDILGRERYRDSTLTSGVQVVTEGHRTILADQPRTVLSVRQLARGIRAFGARRVVVVISDMGMLDTNDAAEAARVLGSLAGIAVLVEDRIQPETFERIKQAMMNSTDPPAIVVRQQSEATLSNIRSLLEDGDVALLLTDDPTSLASS